jgi:hypothetical protein
MKLMGSLDLALWQDQAWLNGLKILWALKTQHVSGQQAAHSKAQGIGYAVKPHHLRENHQVMPAEFTDSVEINEAHAYYQADGRDSQKNSPHFHLNFL